MNAYNLDFKGFILYHGEKENPFTQESRLHWWWRAEEVRYNRKDKQGLLRYKNLLDIFKHDSPEFFPKDYSQINKEVIAWVMNEIYTFSGGYEEAKKEIDIYRRQFCIKHYCLYFNNEKYCPFKDNLPEYHFWYLERQYLFLDDEDKKKFEASAKEYAKSHKDVENFITSDAPLFQKGFVMYAEAMLEKWMPYNVHLIFEYGKKSKELRITPERIDHLERNEVFVFGSDIKGHHDGGAARAALHKFGAMYGEGFGHYGQSFAIPTTGMIQIMAGAIHQLIVYAQEHPELKFLVTPIGCGNAGWNPEQVAPLFSPAVNIDNIYLPKLFWDVLNKV